MTYKEYLRRKIFGDTTLTKEDSRFSEDNDRLTFINDDDMLTKTRLKEYNVWYYGDSDELLNYYTYNNTIDYNYEPFYSRNKRNYFWAINSTENDIKRSHSGQPRNIIDTLVGICRFPIIKYQKLNTDSTDVVSRTLSEILDESDIANLYRQEQLPLTLVEGWGCYKINFNKDISAHPYAVYYKAANVDFITRNNKMRAIVFKDYYTDKDGRKYVFIEVRAIKYNTAKGTRDLHITYELFKLEGDDTLLPTNINVFPELAGNENVVIDSFDKFLAVPCIIYKNTGETGGIGRSIFTGKIDLFDDLDQCLSQASNSVRKSTPIEYFNSEFLERDKNGLPIMPHAYDRKYTIYNGMRSSEGEVTGGPVQVTQPQLNFNQYSEQAVQIMLQIINGIMSPATLGIDIAKKDNAEAQREKEKITIFTRNGIIDEETKILKSLCSQLLCAQELMDKEVITVKDYDISVKFSEFADQTFENKLEVLGAALDNHLMSPNMYMDKLYGDTLQYDEFIKERDWIIEHNIKPHDEGMKGITGGMVNIPGMEGIDPRQKDENAI